MYIYANVYQFQSKFTGDELMDKYLDNYYMYGILIVYSKQLAFYSHRILFVNDYTLTYLPYSGAVEWKS